MIYHLYTWKRNRLRGKRIASFASYNQLKGDAQRRAVLAGYPKSRWMDLYDWSRD